MYKWLPKPIQASAMIAMTALGLAACSSGGEVGNDTMGWGDSTAQGKPRIGVWLTNVASSLYSNRQEIDTAMSTLKKTGFNSVYPTVWNKGATFFKHDIAYLAPMAELAEVFSDLKSSNLVDPSRDVFGEIVAAADKIEDGKKLEVFAWFEWGLKIPYGLVSGGKVQPFGFIQKLDADGMLLPRIFRNLKTVTGGEANCMDVNLTVSSSQGSGSLCIGYLDPASPKVRALALQMAQAVITRYPSIAGLMIDDHFSIDKAAFGSHTAAVTAIMRELGAYVHQTGKKYILAPLPSINLARSLCQDWMELASKDRSRGPDEIIFQTYRYQNSQIAGDLSGLATFLLRVPWSLGVITGLYRSTDPAKRVDYNDIKQQTATILKSGRGVSFFYYETLFKGQNGTESAQRGQELNTLLPQQVR
jgi:uncharacterized lipoprotein YddW (UPF0748 family)